MDTGITTQTSRTGSIDLSVGKTSSAERSNSPPTFWMLDRAAKIRVIVPAVTGVALIAAGVAVGILSAGILSPVSIALWGAGGFLLSGSICAYEYEMSKLESDPNLEQQDCESQLIEIERQRYAKMQKEMNKSDSGMSKSKVPVKTQTELPPTPHDGTVPKSGKPIGYPQKQTPRTPIPIPPRFQKLASKIPTGTSSEYESTRDETPEIISQPYDAIKGILKHPAISEERQTSEKRRVVFEKHPTIRVIPRSDQLGSDHYQFGIYPGCPIGTILGANLKINSTNSKREIGKS